MLIFLPSFGKCFNHITHLEGLTLHFVVLANVIQISELTVEVIGELTVVLFSYNNQVVSF